MLSKQMIAFNGGLGLFLPKYLGPWPGQDHLDTQFHASRTAALRHGQLNREDMLYMRSGEVAVADDFWQAPGGDAIVARATACRKSGMGHNSWVPLVERRF
eukprot:1794719-Pyramimonas_sp.AAC.1